MNFAAIIIFAIQFDATSGAEITFTSVRGATALGLTSQLHVLIHSLCVLISEGDFWVPVAVRLPAFHSSQALG